MVLPLRATTLFMATLALLAIPEVRAAHQNDAPTQTYDVVVYGGTSAGVVAAVQAKRCGKTALLIEPGRHLGGLTSGGLGATDIGNKAAIGGISRDFYRRVKRHYDNPEAWRQQRREDYRSRRQRPGEDTMWTFEPHVAEQIMKDLVAEAGVQCLYESRLDRARALVMDGQQIRAIHLEDGRTIHGRQFIDATYEGDLMALAGVDYHVGREANATYGETLNGVQTANAVHHQFHRGVDPYVIAGDASSGLLPGVHGDSPGEEGAGDHRVQAYCFRMCVTDAPENLIPIAKPEGYDPQRYELLLRNFEAGADVAPWHPTPMPNRKTDVNNNRGFSTDNIGMNYEWPEADYATRERIFQEHLHYQTGLLWTLANNPRVPQAIRQEIARWGKCKDEFHDYGGWSHQLYVREARRMVSDCVMTQHHCQGRETVSDPVGLAAYTMDSHNVQRYVDDRGDVRNEGDVQVGGFPPYGISYQSIVPKARQCTNLFVPVCLSASHIAYGSIRMEPVFMVLGQSAATAACLCIDNDCAAQQLDYEVLREQLVADEQVLVWTGPRPSARSAVDPARLPGIVVDDASMVRDGAWTASSASSGFVGVRYWHDSNEGQGTKTARFPFRTVKTGRHEVRLAYPPNPNRATNARVSVRHAGGETVSRVNQKQAPVPHAPFVSLGTFEFVAGTEYWVEISNHDADGYVIADAVQVLPEGS